MIELNPMAALDTIPLSTLFFTRCNWSLIGTFKYETVYTYSSRGCKIVKSQIIRSKKFQSPIEDEIFSIPPRNSNS